MIVLVLVLVTDMIIVAGEVGEIVDELNEVEKLTTEPVKVMVGTVLVEEDTDGLQEGGRDECCDREYDSDDMGLEVELEAVIGPTGDEGDTLIYGKGGQYGGRL